MDKQDGKASIPQWYRSWITATYGTPVIDELDRIGALHDEEIGTQGYGQANEMMRARMSPSILPVLSVRLPVSLAIGFYRWLPPRIKKLYWRKN